MSLPLGDIYQEARESFETNPGWGDLVPNPKNHIYDFESPAHYQSPYIIVSFPSVTGAITDVNCFTWQCRIAFLIGTAAIEGPGSTRHFANFVGDILQGIELQRGTDDLLLNVMALEEMEPAEQERFATRAPDNRDWQVAYWMVIN